MTSPKLGRRALLRGTFAGAALGLALPRLEAMLNTHGTAYADGTELPRRFGLWFFGNGVRADQWVPEQTGPGWTPKEELAPLVNAGLKPYLNVISGLEIKTPYHAHHSGMTGITTGAPMKVLGNVRDTIASTVSAPSIDMVAAAALAGQTSFRSLELGVCKFTGTDEGTTFQYLSMNGPNDPNPPEYSAAGLYGRLFGLSPQDPRFAQLTRARRSVLDVVSAQITRLQKRVGASDKKRLDQHFESVRAIEKRLASAGATQCQTPSAPVDPEDVSGKEPITEKNVLMSDLLTVALACDLTRVFTYFFEPCGSGTYFWQTDASDGMHSMCHAGANDLVHRAVVFTMERCAETLTRLRDATEGNSTLLDQSSILITTEHTQGDTHSQSDFPILTAGRGGGKLKSGTHVRIDGGNTTRALLTVLRGAGLALDEFGADEGHVTEGIGELEG